MRWSRCLPPIALALVAATGGGRLAGQSPPLFVDGTAASGLVAHHDDGDRGRRELMAIMGPGAALLDYDLDGDLDLYVVLGGPLPGDPSAGAPRGALLRNDLARDAAGGLRVRWVEVTATANLAPEGHGTGVAVGDVDGDGLPDLLLAGLSGEQLWRNRGDGRFVRDAAALPDAGGWSVSGSFFDADADGDLDLYLARYADAPPGTRCFAESTRRDYCGPAAYPAIADRLLRNEGGAFRDVSLPAGIAGGEPRPGLGVVAGDFTGDGHVDLYVANDGEANLLWRNRGDGSFVDDALVAGAALSRDGRARAGMGVDAADADGDGDEELLVTNLTGETNTLYVATGEGLFADRTVESGLGPPSLPWTGFGTAFVDADLDGWLDLLVVNGAVRLAHGGTPPTTAEATGAPPTLATGSARVDQGAGASREAADAAAHQAALAQPGQLYRNRGEGRFLSDDAAAGALATPSVSRGLAVGDLDLDGDADAVVAVNGGPARLLLAVAPTGAGWVGAAPCPGVADAPWLASTITVRAAGAAPPSTAPRRRRPHRDGSYASARDPRVVVGLGGAGAAAAVEVAAGSRLRWVAPPAGRYLLWCPR
jgi:enediyne biosynthesis protein E4